MGYCIWRLRLSQSEVQNSEGQGAGCCPSFVIPSSIRSVTAWGGADTAYLLSTGRPTSVVDVPEGRVDELAHVTGPLCDVQQHWDGVIAAIAQVQQRLGQAGLPRGWLWGVAGKGSEPGCESGAGAGSWA